MSNEGGEPDEEVYDSDPEVATQTQHLQEEIESRDKERKELSQQADTIVQQAKAEAEQPGSGWGLGSALFYFSIALGLDQKQKSLLAEQEKFERSKRVLDNQSARKLHHKRRMKAAQQERARLAKEAEEKKKRFKENTALKLLERGQPVRIIAQVTGLSEQAVNALRRR
ncbi:MAG: hypothetical protein ROO73_04775 [Roseivirga sp.]